LFLFAHALQARQDLPIPVWLFAWGAALVLIVSFALLSNSWRTVKLQAESWKPGPNWLSRALLNPVTQAVCGLIGIGLLVATVYAGLKGTEAPDRNLAVTFAFVTFWLGLVALSVLFGDVFRAFNPWRAFARGVSGAFRLVAGQSAPPALRYPEWLGHWPAVLGLFGFVWLELIYGATGLTGGIDPHTVAVASIVYSAITLVAMALFGIDEWLERGETFSVYFRMFSRLAVPEVRDGQVGRRKFLTGATSWGLVAGALPLVLVAIGSTSFDGAQEGLLKFPIKDTFGWFTDLGLGPVAAYRLNATAWLLVVIGGLSGFYWLGIWGMHTVDGSPPVRQLGRSFAHTLVPISLAYLVAHYFSLVVFQEQAQFTYLLSDPLGEGSNLFGTADTGVNFTIIGSNAIWYTQVASLVIGHVIALTLAHDRALAVYEGNLRRATRSQYWMLFVMVGFTVFGLLLLSQANS
jgi:hypothetical protein